MKNIRFKFLFTMAVLLLPLCAAAAIRNYRLIDTPAGMNIRSKPSINGRKISAAPYKAVVKVLQRQSRPVTIGGKRGYWIRIQWKTNYGWIFDYYTKPVNRALSGITFLTTTTGTDYIPRLYFRNNSIYFTWGSVGSTGYRLGRYSVNGSTVTARYHKEVRVSLQTMPGAKPEVWKKTTSYLNKTVKYTIDLGLDHKVGYVILMRGNETFMQNKNSAWNDIKAIDKSK